ncbi:hypothetical protein PILCRDRAFT_17383 [Piloderma croceum F 1598]|uniref:Major facilitator superfamily (MFS) profile domain-containing protein n=1 Tax=Piloderma croceum (strain F 1598) TaxID=765440 RepID=A0A0C3ABF8_PILCF|nr:hypothetical protein PILCRDRAFT_17383 [Piloderma croceum F 1598]
MVWTTGAIIGPLVGGLLARPADRWPHTLGRLTFFCQYPYFLPCITAAFVSVSAFLVAAFLLNETLPHDLRHHGISGGSINVARQLEEVKSVSPQLPSTIEVIARPGASAVTHVQPSIEVVPYVVPVAEGFGSDSLHTSRMDTKHPTLRSLLVRPVLLTIINYAFLAFIDQCFVVLQPLMYSSSISVGGLGFSSFTIGMILGIWGVISGIISIFAFPKVLRKFGIRRLYMAAFASYLVCLAGFPIMSIFVQRSGSVDAKVWIVLVLQLVFYILANMGYGCIFLYINDGAPRSALGALNGLAQTTASTMRALAPSTASSLFAVSLERDVVRGNMVYMVLCAITAAGNPTNMSTCEVDAENTIIADEQTALLTRTVEKPTPLPRLQISIVLLLLLAEPITSQCIIPFINQLISELDVTGGDERKVGFFSGLIVSLFFAAEAVTVMQWSRLSDHIGRKPVLLTGLFGLFISMIFFGLSRTFWALVVSRCLAGVLNGNVGVMKSMMAELTDSTNIAQGLIVPQEAVDQITNTSFKSKDLP